MEVRRSEPEEREAVAAFFAARSSARVARRGVVEDPLAHPALIAAVRERAAGGLHAAVADHRQRQRRRAALPPASRVPAPELHAGAVDDSRARLKPEIPRVGDHGTPLRVELELELDL